MKGESARRNLTVHPALLAHREALARRREQERADRRAVAILIGFGVVCLMAAVALVFWG
jgi:hypothetical protein